MRIVDDGGARLAEELLGSPVPMPRRGRSPIPCTRTRATSPAPPPPPSLTSSPPEKTRRCQLDCRDPRCSTRTAASRTRAWRADHPCSGWSPRSTTSRLGKLVLANWLLTARLPWPQRRLTPEARSTRQGSSRRSRSVSRANARRRRGVLTGLPALDGPDGREPERRPRPLR